MSHREYIGVIQVGCICAGVMEGNILAAKERDIQAKRKSQRKSHYLKKHWEAVESDCWKTCYKRKAITIVKDSFRERDFYKIDIDGEMYQWKDNHRMSSFLAAQHFVFDIIESGVL